MTILVDSREQAILEFNHPYISGIEIGKLDCGDYGCRFSDDHSPAIYFERKNLGDLFGTMGTGYARFKKELIRANEANISLILIIEGSFFKVLAGYEHSTIEGISIIRKLFTLWVKYGLIPVFVNSREEMSQFITEFYIGVGKQHVEKGKNEKDRYLGNRNYTA